MMSRSNGTESAFFTSESVTEGHPDKVCDQISDAVLDAVLADDPFGRVACESAATTGLIMVFGEIATSTYVEIPELVRQVIRDIGYTDSSHGFDAETCGVLVSLKAQSPEIAGGVGAALEVREKADAQDKYDQIGAGDQGMMIGYACNETPELMPMPIALSHRIARELSVARKTDSLPWLLPDGKSQVTVEYENGKPVRVDAIVVSTQHHPTVHNDEIKEGVLDMVIGKAVPGEMLDKTTKYFVNPSGRFTLGGPIADAGLTGRKIIVDTYGGMARHGGGAFSGKDPSKVDRSAAYAMRWVAKNIVAAGLATQAEVQVAYAIGKAHPVGVFVETFGTGVVSDEVIQKAVLEVFDLRPAAIIRDLDLLRPIYAKTAAYGHFGRELPEFTWERTDRAEALKAAAGL